MYLLHYTTPYDPKQASSNFPSLDTEWPWGFLAMLHFLVLPWLGALHSDGVREL